MNTWVRYVPLQILIGVVIGVLTAYYYTTYRVTFFTFLISYTIITILLFCFKKLKMNKVFFVTAFFSYICIGYTAMYFSTSKNFANYYKTLLHKNNLTTLKINKVLKHNNKTSKYYASVIQIDNKKTIGNILLTIKHDPKEKIERLITDDYILTNLKLQEIPPNKNPYNFNYKEYLKKIDIYEQCYLQRKDFILLNKTDNSVTKKIYRLKQKIIEKLQAQNILKETKNITSALLLGDKTELSKKTSSNFINAGVIHILAISGLHIGIIAYLLLILLSPLNKIKNGKTLKKLTIIIILWCFAIFSGFSSSTVRAVCMLSFVFFGKLTNKDTPVYFSLISSMLILILFNPFYIFDIGFQLSYIAVFGIITIQPLFIKLWNPKRKIISYFWNLIAVSTAAQIAVLPISVFYFNQFSGLFLISNLLILPFITLIICFGIIVLLSTLLNLNFEYLLKYYDLTIYLLNTTINKISKLDTLIIKNIYISNIEMISWYCCIISLTIFFKTFEIKKIKYILISYGLIIALSLYKQYNLNQQEKLIVFHQKHSSALAIQNKNTLTILSDTNRSKPISRYTYNEGIFNIINKELPNIFNFNKKNILIVDSLGIYKLKHTNNPIILLRKSPKVNLERLIKLLKPELIIADGSNYKKDIKTWKITCKHKKTPFHNTYENGAYIFSKKNN